VITRTSKDEAINQYKVVLYDLTTKGILPDILMRTLHERDIEKLAMKKAQKEGRTHDALLHDFFQLNRKLRGNSIYGLMAFTEYSKSDPDLAQSCTSIAYELLRFLQNVFSTRVRARFTKTSQLVSLEFVGERRIVHPVINQIILMPDITYSKVVFYESISDEKYFCEESSYVRVYHLEQKRYIIASLDLDDPTSDKYSILAWMYNSDLISHLLGQKKIELTARYENKLAQMYKHLGQIAIPPFVPPSDDECFTEKYYTIETVYGDTDSVFLEHISDDRTNEFAVPNLQMVWHVGQLEQEIINNSLLYKPLNVKMEKLITHFRNPDKKKYSGIFYESYNQIAEGLMRIKAKGFSYVQRDKCSFHKSIAIKAADIYAEGITLYWSIDEIRSKIIEYLIATLRERLSEMSSIEGFVKSRKYTVSNNPKYIPNIKVQEYNRVSIDKRITEGSRYNYVLVVDRDLPLGSHVKTLHDLEYIVDNDKLVLTDKRVYFENYYEIILRDVTSQNSIDLSTIDVSRIWN
jgi:hypothetical protein